MPLARGTLVGDANIATHAHEGESGEVPACSVRGRQVLNICELNEQGPVVLALFVNGGSCPACWASCRRSRASFPGVRFAAVAIKGDRARLRRLIAPHGPHASRSASTPTARWPRSTKSVSCPQVSFVYPGGVVQSGRC